MMKREDEQRIKMILPLLNERQKRIFLSLEAERLGKGSISALAKLTGISKATIIKGKKDLEEIDEPKDFDKAMGGNETIRSPGGGRKKIEELDLDLEKALYCLLDHGGPLLYSVNGARFLANRLAQDGHPVSHAKIVSMIRGFGFDLDSCRSGPLSKDSLKERSSSFGKINSLSKQYLDEGFPVVFVSLKKVEGGPSRDACDNAFPSSRRKWNEFVSTIDMNAFLLNLLLQWWEGDGKARFADSGRVMIVLSLASIKTRLSMDELLTYLVMKLGLNVDLRIMPIGAFKWRSIEKKITSNIYFGDGVSLRSSISLVH